MNLKKNRKKKKMQMLNGQVKEQEINREYTNSKAESEIDKKNPYNLKGELKKKYDRIIELKRQIQEIVVEDFKSVNSVNLLKKTIQFKQTSRENSETRKQI